jgi:PiT family inorganic phosphate transporter
MQRFTRLFSTLRLILVVGFLAGAASYTGMLFHHSAALLPLVLAALFGGYMAVTIGANDAANNLGVVVGSKAITLTWALLIGILLEIAGALIAGDNVMHTIKTQLIDTTKLGSEDDIVWLMLSALLAAALWVHLATAMKAPISTTHAIIGGMVGVSISVGGLDIANWPVLWVIASSWLVAPLMGGLLAAAILYLIKQTLTYQTNMTKAAKRVVPILVAAMGWAFTAYLMLKGLHPIWPLDLASGLLSSLVIAIGIYLIIAPVIEQAADRLPQSKIAINTLFNIPLVFAAAILCFAHGSNDAANAIGPIAAVYEITTSEGLGLDQPTTKPLWILLIGALGLGLGIALYGPRLIKVVGSEITELDQIRAYSITMSLAITVIVASELSLPVSTTHVAVGAVLGVGFLREYLKKQNAEIQEKIIHHLSGKSLAITNRFLDEFYAASFVQKRVMLKQLETHSVMGELSKQKHQELNKLYRKELVRRSVIIRIVTAWVLTIPITGIFASLIYLLFCNFF